MRILALLGLVGLAAWRAMSGGIGTETADPAALFPAFRERLDKLFADLRALGFYPQIRATWRSPERQRYYREQGWSQVDVSFHTVTSADGRPEALAADVEDSRWDADDEKQAGFYVALRQLSTKQGLETGGTFAKTNATWKKYGLGWDPGHLQPVGITIEQAHKGARPWT